MRIAELDEMNTLTCSAFVLDSDWTYHRTGETYRLLYWERDFVLLRKVRGLDGLVGEVVKISPAQFRECYTLNAPAHRPAREQPNP